MEETNMKKLLALVFIFGLSVSVFAVPICSEWSVEGGDAPMYNRLLGKETGAAQEPPDVEFYCKVADIEPGETYYLNMFSWQSLPIGSKNSSSESYFNKKSLISMIKTYKYLEATEQDKNKLAKYQTIRENFENELASNSIREGEYYKIWYPTNRDTTLPTNFYGDWPTKVREDDNGTEFKVEWVGGYGNQPETYNLTPSHAFSFIGFCTSKSDLSTCVGVEDRYDMPRTNYFGAYEVDSETYKNLTNKTITISHGATDLAQTDIYITTPEFNIALVPLSEWFGDNLDEYMGEHLIAHKNLGIREPLAGNEVEYAYFQNIESGTHILYTRYIRKPHVPTTRGYYAAVFDTKGIVDYVNAVGIEEQVVEIKKKVFTALNNQVGSQNIKIRVPEGYAGSIMKVYNEIGQLVGMQDLTVGDDNAVEINGADGMYFLKIENTKEGISETIKVIKR